jgi:uncharacterized membrane protein
MTVVTHAISVMVLLGSGTTAGVLFAVAMSTVPALATMTPDRFVYTHTLLGRHWDPTMPAIVLTTTVLDATLAGLASGGSASSLFIVATVCLLGVSLISHLGNVPINRRIHQTDPNAIPPGWRDPRPLWRRWHLLRTTLAVLALAANGLAVTLLF